MSSIKFKLFAPYNTEAAVMGDFSDWEGVAHGKRGRTAFFAPRSILQDGSYQYKFRVRTKSWFFDPDTWVEVVDPYATDIDDANQTGILRGKRRRSHC